MIKIKKFIINEKLGIVDSTEPVIDFLSDQVDTILDNYLLTKKRKDKTIKVYKEDKLNTIINSNDWNKFPIKKIRVEYLFESESDKLFKSNYPITSKIKNYVISGSILPIKQCGLLHLNTLYIDGSLHLSMEIGGSINRDKFTKDDIDRYKTELHSVISHELNHAYEIFCRFLKKSPDLNYALSQSVDINRANIAKPIFKFWYYGFASLLYKTEKQEINAMVHESYPYIKRYGLDEMKNICPVWKEANDMINFNSSEFIKKMKLEINKYNRQLDTNRILNTLKNSLSNEIRNNMKNFKEYNSSITPDQINKMDFCEFIEFSQSRINDGGLNLKKRILRLYARK